MPNLSNDVYDLLLSCKDLDLTQIHTHIMKRGHRIHQQDVVDIMIDLSRNYKIIYEAVLCVQGLTLHQKLRTLLLPLIKEPNIETIYSDMGMGTAYIRHWPWYMKNRKHHKKIYRWLEYGSPNLDRSRIWEMLVSLQIIGVDPKILRTYCDLFQIKHYPTKGSLDLCDPTEAGALTVCDQGGLTCI